MNHSVEEGVPVDQTHDMSAELMQGIKTSWLLLCTFLVVSMQLGFAMIEVGSVREAHRMTVLAKNVMDSAVSCLVFAIATGESFWESTLVLDSSKGIVYSDLLYHWAFCATCVTICSGSMAERTHIIGYLTHAGIMAGVIFPPLAEAVWGSGGFLRPFFVNAVHQDIRYHDCAGSGVVHLVGGVAALAGNSLLGRRIMRLEDVVHEPEGDFRERLEEAPGGGPAVTSQDMEFEDVEQQRSPLERPLPGSKDLSKEDELTPEGRWQRRFDNAERDKTEFQPCNYLQVMGMFILWVGWYGFNTGGSLTAEPGSSHTAGLVAWNTTVAAAAGGFGSYLYLYGFRMNLDVGFLCNGLLSGLVSITACCDVSTPLTSMLIGLVSGAVVYPMTSNGMRRLRLDDPVDAVPVHAASGLFGILVVGLCSPDCAVLREKGLSQAQSMFCRDEHHIGRQLLAQLLGGFAIIVWTFFISYVFWLLLAAAECVRALELEQVNRAETLLRQLTGQGALSKSKVHQDLESAAHLSRTVRRALKEHGWTGSCFLTGQPQDLVSLLTKLQQAQFGSLETALETEVCAPLRILVRCCGSWWLCRELAIARLRIHPWAEISGLGAAETDGGKLYMAIQRAAGQIAELRSQTHAEPLQTEVRELGMLVRSQDILLRRLVSRRYSNLSNSRRLRHIPELSSLRQESAEQRVVSPSSPNCEVAQEDSPESQLSTARSLRSGLSSRTAWQDSGALPNLPPNFRLDLLSETASTVSDASLGALSPHSVASTPPPTIHGRVSRRLPSNGAPVMNVAEQLVQMLQMQQQLLSAIGAPTGPQAPSTSAMSSQPMSQHATLLCQALQQVADQAVSPASSRRESSSSHLDAPAVPVTPL